MSKIGLIILIVLSVQATSFAQTITLTGKGLSLSVIFSEIKKQTGYVVLTNRELIKNIKPLSVAARNQPLADFLQIILKGTLLEFTIDKKTITISKKNDSPLTIDFKSTANDLSDTSKKITVHGRVINEKGDPVIATVTMKGTNNAVSSSNNGEFVIKEAAQNAILVVSGITIQTIELKLAGRQDLTIKTTIKVAAQEEVTVVNTGYQKIKPERFVGAVSQLDSAAYSRREGMGIIERLDGTVTGLLFDKKRSGSDIRSTLQVRGISTLGGTDGVSSSLFNLLIIVDDFPFEGDLNNLNSNDVQSINILKDAAATSIWGARAGNGVIVITTKKGKYNQPFNLSIHSTITVKEKPDLYKYPKMSSADFIDAEEYAFNNHYYDAILTDQTTRPVVSPVIEILAKYRSGGLTQMEADNQINSFRQIDLRNDLSKYVNKNAITQQHYMSINGGNNIISYNFSSGYNYSGLNVKGGNPGEQWTINSSMNVRPFKNFEVQMGVNVSQNHERLSGFSLPNIYPYAQLADAAGNSLAVPFQYRLTYIDTAGGGQLLDWHYKPLDEINNADNDKKTQLLRLNFGVSYRFSSWLNGSLQMNYNLENSSNKNYYSLESWAARNLINTFTNLTQSRGNNLRYPVPMGGILDLTHIQSHSNFYRWQFNSNKTWNDHSITAMVAGEFSQSDNRIADSHRIYGYNDRGNSSYSYVDYSNTYPIYINSSGSSNIPSTNNYQEGNLTRFLSFISNLSYTYKKRYTVYASARKDGSNLFGVTTNNRWKPLWSIGSRWDISKENFYHSKWLSTITLRASYGYSGNSGGASAFPQILYAGNTYLDNFPLAVVVNYPNPDLKWEQVGTTNIGVDFTIIDRITGSTDFFIKKSTDLISPVPFDPTSGLRSFPVNAASLRGSGFELSVNSVNTMGIIKWETNLGVSYTRTIVTKVYNGKFKASDFVNYGLHPSVGKPAYSIAAYRWAGLDPLTGDPRGYYGKVVSNDYSKIFQDSVDNQVFIGSSQPLYSAFITNSIKWRNLSLSANITGRFGFYFRKASINYGALFSSWSGNVDYVLRWQKPGDEAITNVPSMIYPLLVGRDQFYAGSEVNVVRGDNIRLQDIRLQYLFQNKKAKRLPVREVQLSLYVNNLNMIFWRAEKSAYDPDYAGGGTLEAAPPSQTWTISANINF